MKIRELFNTITGRKHKHENYKKDNFIDSFIKETRIDCYDREHIWIFMAGQYSQDFRGNPKYLFAYINKYRPDIFAYWACNDEETLKTVKELGYRAYNINSLEAEYLIDRTGVIVAEQVKMNIPKGLENAKYLNLWHGVGGVKPVEKKLTDPLLIKEIAKKYITNNEYYINHELYLAPSRFIHDIAINELGLSDNQIIHGGYPRCLYQQFYEPIVSFDHDIISGRNLPDDTTIAAYVPTYRSKDNDVLFTKAIPDMERLIKVCEEKHLLMIFKMHPLLEKEVDYQYAKKMYSNCKWLVFWDNKNDFYEIISDIDLCIMDYSSIFTDFVAVGTKKFIRYTFDFDNKDLSFPMDYDESTLGKRCRSYSELLDALYEYKFDNYDEDIERIKNLYWEYSDKDSFDYIIDRTIDFQIEIKDLPVLYSFDIFDTLVTRKTLSPIGIFYGVMNKIVNNGSFPYALCTDYPSIRKNAEAVVREYYKRTKDLRNSNTVEVTLYEIIQRIKLVYGLTENQAQLLYDWELELELDNVLPISNQIERVKRLVAAGNTVVLISDMYLPKSFIEKMLEFIDPMLTQLPLFLSVEYGVQKVSKLLFLEVYKSFGTNYSFSKWIHTGDNPIADYKPAKALGIKTQMIDKPTFTKMQEEMVSSLNDYDSYLVAAAQARLCQSVISEKEKFIISYVSLCMVPYIDWVLRDAQKKKYTTLYFISRDGYHLKRIADAIISERKLQIKTKYIYASRRVWWVPSFISEVDDDFWLPHGNFTGIVSKEKLFRAMKLDEAQFNEFFPFINLDSIDFFNKKEFNNLLNLLKTSVDYRNYLLSVSAKERRLSGGYLKQEIDPNEKFAIVEYWGRGYTQDCMVRIWQEVTGNKEATIPFYYTRSVLQTTKYAIRFNFTTNAVRQFFLEGLFANLPYKSIEEYEEKNGVIEPIIENKAYDDELYAGMCELLPKFAKEYAKLDLLFPEDTDHRLFDYVLDYYNNNLDNQTYIEQIGTLIDSVQIYGEKRQFAPPFTLDTIDSFKCKKKTRKSSSVTSSITMSFNRSTESVQKEYLHVYNLLPDEDVTKGNILEAKDIETSKIWEKKYTFLHDNAERLKAVYDSYVNTYAVKNEILILVDVDDKKHSVISNLINLLHKRSKYKVVLQHLSRNDSCPDDSVIKLIATAKYIILLKPIGVLGLIHFRVDTEVILLPAKPFTIYNEGMELRSKYKWKQLYKVSAFNNDLDVIHIPSENAKTRFKEAYANNINVTQCVSGNYNTDIYLNDKFKTNSYNKLYSLFPQAINKKILLYMPKCGYRNTDKNWLNILDIETLQSHLNEDYVIIIWMKESTKNTYNKLAINDFSTVFHKEMDARELMSCCDIIVGGYIDEFFEAPILHKPAFLDCSNEKGYLNSANAAFSDYNIEDLQFCPKIHSSQELVKWINKIDQYDYSRMDVFREKYLGKCDGHSLERVVNAIVSSK